MRYFILSAFFLLSLKQLSAQVVNDFRTVQSGDWNNAGTWERYNGVAWEAAVATPTNTNNEIAIQATHEVALPSGFSVSADQLLISGSLTVLQGGQLTLTDGPGIDLTVTTVSSSLTVSGTFLRQNGTTISNPFDAGRIQFGSASQYFHNYTLSVGDLPSATWDPQSTVYFQTFANTGSITANNTWDQAFGNIVYNSPNQGASVDFAGNLKTIRGNLTIQSTGNNALQLSSNQNPAITIGDESSGTGDLVLSGTSRLIFATTGAATTVTVYGDWTYTSTHTTGSYLTFSGSTTLELYGNFNMDAGGGRFHLASGGTTGRGTMNLHGDFNFQSGRIDELGSEPTRGELRFINNGAQNFVNNGTIAGHINYYVAPTAIVDLSTYSFIGASPSSFTLDGGTIIVGSLHALGAMQTATTGGNIRTPNTYRTYASGSTIIYRAAAPQYVGTGQPTGNGITTIIDNDVNLATNATINGVLRLESGTLNLSNFSLTAGGTLEVLEGMLGGNSLSSLIIQGTTGGEWGTMTFDPQADTLGTLTLNRTGAGAGVSLNSSLTVASQLNLTRGNFNNLSDLSMVDGATITRYDGSALIGASPLISEGFFNVTYRTFSPAGGPYADFSAGPELPPGANELGALVINSAQINDVVRLSRSITPNGNITLTRGTLHAETFTITMQGETWTDNSGNFDAGSGWVIFNDSTVVGGTSGTIFRNIGLTVSSYLEVTRSFTIQGDVDFAPDSRFNMADFTAVFSGSNFQTISAGGQTFSNITIAKSDNQGMILTSQLNLTGLLQFSVVSSSVDFNSNGFLTVISTSDSAGGGTGIIYRLQSGNTVSGNVIVQRYLSSEGKIYRYLSSPVSGAMVSEWKDDFLVQGNFQDPSPTTIICGGKAVSTSTSLYYYDEATAAYVAYPSVGSATTNSPIEPGRGYTSYIRQCGDPVVVDVVGPINQGTFAIPVTYTATSADPGWNLVGNPYPATIDWDLSGTQGWSKTRISPVIGIMDNGSGMTRYYDPGVAEDIPNGQIATGQAFWVRATAAEPILIIREGVKVNMVAEYFREATPDISFFSLKLSDGKLWDKAYVKLHAEANASLDDYDAPKIANRAFNFSTVTTDNISMAINALNEFGCNTEIRLSMNDVTRGNYQIGVEKRGQFKGYRLTLIDRFLNKETVLGSSAYSFEISEAAGSGAPDRFILRVEELLPDVALNASLPREVCGQSSSPVLLSSTEKDVKYSLWTTAGLRLTDDITGTGRALSLSLQGDSLAEGSNEIIIQAQRYCNLVPFATSFTVVKGSPTVTSVNSTGQCQRGPVKLTATSNMSAGNFYWYEQKTGGEAIYSGAEFETPVLLKPKTYYVAAVSAGGECVSERVPVKADVVVYDPVKINASKSTLTSSYTEGNQWFFNGTALDETTPTIPLTLPGEYEVVVTLGGCTTTDRYSFLSEEGLSSLVEINAYPNPVLDKLTIEVLNDEVERIEFTTLTGQLLTAVDAKNGREHTVDFSVMADGTYLMIVTKNNTKQSYRLIKRSK